MPKKKAFVVDDNRSTAESLAKMLTLMEIEAVVCLGPREAIQRLSSGVPDFMTLDVNMPGVSGLEVVKYIRRDPRIADLPVIIISSDTQTADMAKALLAGANVFLPKPVDFDRLELAVKDILSES
ncbi:MAG: response regulator [Chloroflexi bacterium]|nr:response regulator [Chloroflexota bacterium]